MRRGVTGEKTNVHSDAVVGQAHLVPARDPAWRHPGVEQLVGAAEEEVERLGRVALLERPVGQLGQVPGGRRRLERIAQAQPGMADADLGDHVECPPVGQLDAQLGERLDTPAEARGRSTDALGDGLELAVVGRDQGQHAVRLAQVEPGEDDRLGRVAARNGHRCDGSTE